MLLAAALTLGLSLSAETMAPAAKAPPPTSTTGAASAKPVLKCQKLTLLGSRMPVRVCRSEEQIRQSQQDARDTTADFQKINPEQISK